MYELINPDEPRWARLTAQLLADEGRRLKIYPCSAGKLTGGVGHNFTDLPVPGIKPYVGMPLTDRQVDDLYFIDRRVAIGDATVSITCWWRLCPARQDALVNMTFNLGIGGLLKFRRLLAALSREEWSSAVHELDDSIWSHQVDDGIGGRIGRADRIAALIITGKYPDER